MPELAFGNHAAVIVDRAERDRVRAFYAHVLGGTFTRQTDLKDDLQLGAHFIAFLYADQGVALDDSGFLKAMYLELKTDDVEEMRERIVGSGVKVLDVPDPHLYFQAPGGQVWRLVGIGEDLSAYEGTDALDATSRRILGDGTQ